MIYYRKTLFGRGPKLASVHQINVIILYPIKMSLLDLKPQ